MTTAIEETYDEVKDLIHHLTHRFLAKKGIGERDYEDWHGESCKAFVSSHQNFDRQRGRFTTHLWHRVWFGLSEKMRQDAPHDFTVHWEQEAFEERPEESRESKLDEWFSVMSDDAKTVAMFVVRSFECSEESNASPADLRELLYNMLTGFGWSFHRIVAAFHEIKIIILEEGI